MIQCPLPVETINGWFLNFRIASTIWIIKRTRVATLTQVFSDGFMFYYFWFNPLQFIGGKILARPELVYCYGTHSTDNVIQSLFHNPLSLGIVARFPPPLTSVKRVFFETHLNQNWNYIPMNTKRGGGKA